MKKDRTSLNNHSVSKRNRYLKKTPLAEAVTKFLGAVTPKRRNRNTPVEKALGLTTASPIFAILSAPHYHGAAMDGIAVRARDTFGASEFSPLTLKRQVKKRSPKGSKSKGAAMPAVGGDKEQPKKAGGDRETDPRDKP